MMFKKKKILPPSFPLSSLPDELVLSCLVRVSRSDYKSLSLVSKRYRSLIVSPEFYKMRSLLGYKSLYVCLFKESYSTTQWFMLSREKNLNRFVSRILPFPSQPPIGFTVVVLHLRIYVMGGTINGFVSTSDVLFLDCRTNTSSQAPSMIVPRSYAAAGVIGGKIYVLGGCEFDNDSLSYGEVFDPKTQTWETLASVPDPSMHLKLITDSFVMKEKIYVVAVYNKSIVYSPSEGKWGRGNLDSEPLRYQYVMIDKILYSLDEWGKLFWCENEEFKWKEVKQCPRDFFGYNKDLGNFGENIVVFGRVGNNVKIWCAEISLERHGDEVWGKVEWSDTFKEPDHSFRYIESVICSVSINI